MRFVFAEKAAPVGTVIRRDRLIRLAIQLERVFYSPLLAALQGMQGRVSRTGLIRALADGDIDAVLAASSVQDIEDLIVPLTLQLRQGLAAGGEAAAEALKLRATLDMGRPHIAAWLRDHAGETIKGMTDTSVGAVKAIVRDGVLRGRHPLKMADDIQGVIGLTEPQANAVLRRRRALEAAGASPEKIEATIERYAAKLAKQRAQVIAQTESMTAVSRGRFELWGQLQEQGALEVDQLQRWETGEDEATCFRCGPMNGQKRKLGEPFEVAGGGEVHHPPVHPRCRCSVSLQ